MQKVRLGLSTTSVAREKVCVGSVVSLGLYTGTCVALVPDGDITYVYCVNDEDSQPEKRPYAVYEVVSSGGQPEFQYAFLNDDSRTSAEVIGLEIIKTNLSVELTMYDFLIRDKDGLAGLLNCQSNIKPNGLAEAMGTTARKWLNSKFEIGAYNKVIKKAVK